MRLWSIRGIVQKKLGKKTQETCVRIRKENQNKSLCIPITVKNEKLENFGNRSVIMPGVTVGENSTIGPLVL